MNKDEKNLTVNDYLYTAALSLGKSYSFIETARIMKKRYVLVHFLLMLAILYIPVFFIIVRTQPSEMYQRVFALRFEEARIKPFLHTSFSPEFLLDLPSEHTVIFVFDDLVVFSDSGTTMYAPTRFFNIDEMTYTFDEMFSMIAMYNMYIAHLLIPMLMFSLFVMLVLKVFFYIVTAYFLGAFRILSSIKFSFGERTKISIMSSLPIVLLCAVAGFLVPIVHIILFQLLNLLLLFMLSKKYDRKELEIQVI